MKEKKLYTGFKLGMQIGQKKLMGYMPLCACRKTHVLRKASYLSVFQLSFSMWFSGPSLSKDAMNRAGKKKKKKVVTISYMSLYLRKKSK